MKVLGIRFCSVSSEAAAQAQCLRDLGLRQLETEEGEGFSGAIFLADTSWVEIWQANSEMPEGIMLQLVVDDADAFADHARQNGLEPQGPVDAHGERIYFLEVPGGLQMSFQSDLE